APFQDFPCFRDCSVRSRSQRPLCVMLCEVWTVTRPCSAQRPTASGGGSIFAERIRTFLPRNSVTAAAITDSVLGVTCCDDRLDGESISFAPKGLTGESAHASWLDAAPAWCATTPEPWPDIAWSPTARSRHPRTGGRRTHKDWQTCCDRVRSAHPAFALCLRRSRFH